MRLKYFCLKMSSLTQVLQDADLLQKVLDCGKALRNQKAEVNALTDAMISYFNARFMETEIYLCGVKAKTSELTDLDDAVKIFLTSMDYQARKPAGIEGKSRRSNLLIHGLSEELGKNNVRHKVITETLDGRFGVKCSSIGRISRLGMKAAK